jgi:hypothetical protein
MVGEAVNRLKGVSLGRGVADGSGVKVSVGSTVGEGVQVGGNCRWGVAVAVGKDNRAGSVGGGKGLNPELGLMKNIRNPIAIHRTTSKTNTVRTFQIIAETFLEGSVRSL